MYSYQHHVVRYLFDRGIKWERIYVYFCTRIYYSSARFLTREFIMIFTACILSVVVTCDDNFANVLRIMAMHAFHRIPANSRWQSVAIPYR